MKQILLIFLLILCGCHETDNDASFVVVKTAKRFDETTLKKEFEFANGQKGVLIRDEYLVDWLEKHKDSEIVALTALGYKQPDGETSSFLIIYRPMRKSSFGPQ